MEGGKVDLRGECRVLVAEKYTYLLLGLVTEDVLQKEDKNHRSWLL